MFTADHTQSRALESFIAHHSKTFHFATSFLAPEKREAIWVLYRFCRETDDQADLVQEGDLEGARQRLISWKNDWLLDAPNHPTLIAFKAICHKYQIPERYSIDLIEGCERDLRQTRYESFHDLSAYCYQVASTVGLMSSYILGFDRAAQKEVERDAIKAGIALQLTNIIRDVKEDLARGRIYLPLKDFQDCQCDPDDPDSWKDSNNFRRLIRLQIQRARELYKNSWSGLKYLDPTARLGVGVALKSYAAILDEVEKNHYDVLDRRHSTTLSKKIGLLPSILFSLITGVY
ncbi:MAG: phytoene/squalene synthase family protein [Candidatus Caenarcaniphilales bacterium]|nr:phytoene/squalene synthase family protein [Candidatus Caenarcaniphilales bacterium]